jgi:hypothetical protein
MIGGTFGVKRHTASHLKEAAPFRYFRVAIDVWPLVEMLSG